jgi:acetylornithine/succinyldiaminopimelate/putrescine aminotransferase
MELLGKLHTLRDSGGSRTTAGLPEATIVRYAAQHADLRRAIDEAHDAFVALSGQYPELMRADEAEQIRRIQDGFINFYQEDAVNPYVPLAARGPWLVTSKGAVIHDSGGYGMLGFGHAPPNVLEAMARPHVMANVMTPSVSQYRLVEALRREIGRTRGGCPFTKFVCLNSGSEAVGLAARITDVNAKLMTDAGGRYAGRTIKLAALKGAFHGRTDRPAQFSDSSRKAYHQHLATFRGLDNLITVAPNDVEGLKAAFAQAEANHWFIEALFLEPVMGEGNPGMATTPAFYAAARELTREHGALLLVDSIQAGLRAHGVLSIIDYPGFEGCAAPDMETYSKALNAGQYPLSVLAFSARAAELYRKGLYGNTMTTNPRAMDVATAVLESLTPELRRNITERGRELVARLEKLAKELPGTITRVQGTGLLLSCELAPQFKCYGAGSTEEFMRLNGVGVIHGGTSSLRFTPHFRLGADEVDLIIEGVRHALVHGPRRTEVELRAAAA